MLRAEVLLLVEVRVAKLGPRGERRFPRSCPVGKARTEVNPLSGRDTIVLQAGKQSPYSYSTCIV